MGRRLPAFEPVGVSESRALWLKYHGNDDVHRILLELARARSVIDEIESYFVSIQKAWIGQNIGQLVAMEKLRLLLVGHRMRQGELAGLPPSSKSDGSEPDGLEPELVE